MKLTIIDFVFYYLCIHPDITEDQALRHCGTKRLSHYIMELRMSGWEIETVMKSGVSKVTGNKYKCLDYYKVIERPPGHMTTYYAIKEELEKRKAA